MVPKIWYTDKNNNMHGNLIYDDQGGKKCGNQEGLSREITQTRGKLISCKSSKIN